MPVSFHKLGPPTPFRSQIADLSEATLNNLLATVESLRNVSDSHILLLPRWRSDVFHRPTQNIAEHRAQRERQERELQVLREAKFKQFEEWQRQQEAAAKEPKEPKPRHLV